MYDSPGGIEPFTLCIRVQKLTDGFFFDDPAYTKD